MAISLRAYAPAGPSAYVVRPDGYLVLPAAGVDADGLVAHLGATFAPPRGRCRRMNTFRPSIDWSDEFLNSTLWVLQVWVITASSLLVVLVLVGRTTEWGRQFWRITGDYFKGRQSAPVWAVVGLLLLSAILVVRINVLLSYYANDLFSALQDHLPARFGEKHWHTRVLVDDPCFRGSGRVLCGADAGGLVLDATVHHALANLAEPSLH